MNKLRNIFRNFCLSFLLLLAINGFAQADKFNQAQELYQTKKPDLAKPIIDSVVLHPTTKNDYNSWTLRSFIYYELSKSDKKKLYSSLRDTIVSSLKRSNSLNPDAENKISNNRLMRTLSVTYFNIAKSLLLDSLNEKRSQRAFDKSKELSLIIKPDTNFQRADIEYYNTVGSTFEEIYNKDKKNKKAQEIAKVALLKVLAIQPENLMANSNLGVLYYNEAVDLYYSLDYGTELSAIDIVQDNMIKLAKQSEQLMNKVYQQDNKNEKAIRALFFIYKTLNEEVKMNLIKDRCKELGIDLTK